MKKKIIFGVIILILVVGVSAWFVFLDKKEAAPSVSQNNIDGSSTAAESSTASQIDASQSSIIPSNFTWIPVNIPQLGISFERPSFWNFQQVITSDLSGPRYGASFYRPAVTNATSSVGTKKSGYNMVLGLGYDTNIVGIPHGVPATPEEFLSEYAPPVSSGWTTRETIAGINLIRSGPPAQDIKNSYDTVDYFIFTKDRIIQFTLYDPSPAESIIAEQMIASFKISSSTGEFIVTPSTFGNYPLGQ